MKQYLTTVFLRVFVILTLKLLMRRLQTNYLKQRSIELRYYNRSDETAVHDATSGRQLLKQEENNKVFSEQLEAQRHEIVETVEDINDIGGAPLR
jgi:hypothetical protein